MQKGFSTLFIVIILGSAALSLAIAFSTSSMWSVQSSRLTKQSSQARFLTYACGEVALEKLREDVGFLGTEIITLNGDDCEYTITNMGGDTRKILVTSVVKSVTQKLEINTDSFNPLNVTSWQEIP
jgi:hypothetical protein